MLVQARSTRLTNCSINDHALLLKSRKSRIQATPLHAYLEGPCACFRAFGIPAPHLRAKLGSALCWIYVRGGDPSQRRGCDRTDRHTPRKRGEGVAGESKKKGCGALAGGSESDNLVEVGAVPVGRQIAIHEIADRNARTKHEVWVHWKLPFHRSIAPALTQETHATGYTLIGLARIGAAGATNQCLQPLIKPLVELQLGRVGAQFCQQRLAEMPSITARKIHVPVNPNLRQNHGDWPGLRHH